MIQFSLTIHEPWSGATTIAVLGGGDTINRVANAPHTSPSCCTAGCVSVDRSLN